MVSKWIYADTIVQFTDLQFHSEFEENVFNEYNETAKFDYFKLYMAVDKNVKEYAYDVYIQEFNNYMTFLDTEELSKYSPKKKIKKTYKALHSKLDKYSDKALFSSIFITREYHCVTATMLYALSYDQLNIPYSIEFIPGHVFLTAYPNKENVRIETTNPNGGIYIYSQQYKSNYIEHLRDYKFISSDEYSNKTIDELFQEYFLKSRQINKSELAGALYNNLGIMYLEKSDFKNAYIAFLKCNYLFPTEQSNFLMLLSLGSLIDQTSASENYYAGYLNIYMKLTKNNLNIDLISDLFSKISYKQLIVNGNINQYKKSHKDILEGVNDTSLLNEINFIFYQEMGNTMWVRHKYLEAQNYFQEALRIKNNNISVQHALIEVILHQKKSYTGKIDELNNFQIRYNQLVDSFPTLLENELIFNLKYQISLELMTYYFQEKNLDAAVQQQNNFEELANAKQQAFNFEIEKDIEAAYSAAAVYYYKCSQYKEAKKVVKNGLKYCPNSYKLQLRLEALK